MAFTSLTLVNNIEGPIPRIGWNSTIDEKQEIANSVTRIIATVKNEGIDAILTYGKEFGDISQDANVDDILFSKGDLHQALNSLHEEQRQCLERIANRIRIFAEAQLKCIKPLNLKITGGKVGHDIIPVFAAGCYAPGGRYSLPSTALMTIIPARVAGVHQIVLANPRPTHIMKAAAAVAGADMLLAIGGPAAIAAMRFGISTETLNLPACDVIVGPGNSYVSEAKRQISGDVRIDMIAGPSELVIVADSIASDPE